MEKPRKLDEGRAEVERLQDAIEVQQFYAWDALRQAVIVTDEGAMLWPPTGGRALRTLLAILKISDPIGIERIDVEVLSSGLYEAVMVRAGLEPDSRVLESEFRLHASRDFDLDPGETLWDTPLLAEGVLDSVHNFSEDESWIPSPNLTHAASADPRSEH